MSSNIVKQQKIRTFRFGLFPRWWAKAELNRRHKDFQSFALPAELPAHLMGISTLIGGPYEIRTRDLLRDRETC